MNQENEPIIEVSAGVIFRDGKVLITRRPAGAHLGGLWEFPGGKRRAAESFEACLIRELREELGIEVSVKELIEKLRHKYPEKTVHLQFFRCVWKEHEPRTLGCPEFKWVTAGELRQHEFPAADARLLQRLETSPGLWQ